MATPVAKQLETAGHLQPWSSGLQCEHIFGWVLVVTVVGAL